MGLHSYSIHPISSDPGCDMGVPKDERDIQQLIMTKMVSYDQTMTKQDFRHGCKLTSSPSLLTFDGDNYMLTYQIGLLIHVLLKFQDDRFQR